MSLITDLPAIFDQFSEARQKGFLTVMDLKEQNVPLVGTYCTFMPQEIAMAAGAIVVSLCSTSDETIEEAEKDLPRNLCPLIKSSYGFAQRRLGNRRAKPGLNHLLQAQDLRFPQRAGSGGAGAVRQLHDVDRLELGHVLVHLLFTVAGGFPDPQVREIEVRAFIGFAEAIAAFDQRAEVARQIFFRFLDGFIGGGAQ